MCVRVRVCACAHLYTIYLCICVCVYANYFATTSKRSIQRRIRSCELVCIHVSKRGTCQCCTRLCKTKKHWRTSENVSMHTRLWKRFYAYTWTSENVSMHHTREHQKTFNVSMHTRAYTQKKNNNRHTATSVNCECTGVLTIFNLRNVNCAIYRC